RDAPRRLQNPRHARRKDRRMSARAQRWACVARMGGIGDNLIAASVLRPLKGLGYNVEVMTSKLAAAVYQNNPFIDKLTVKEDGDIPGGDLGTAWFKARAKECDQFFHLSYSVEVRHALHVNQAPF